MAYKRGFIDPHKDIITQVVASLRTGVIVEMPLRAAVSEAIPHNLRAKLLVFPKENNRKGEAKWPR